MVKSITDAFYIKKHPSYFFDIPNDLVSFYQLITGNTDFLPAIILIGLIVQNVRI